MNDPRSTDRLLAAWFEADAPVSVPDALRDDIHRATSASPPRPAWLARLRGSPMDVIEGGATRRAPRLAPALALLILLLIVLLAAAAFVGSSPPKPDPLALVPPASSAPSDDANRTPSTAPSVAVTPTPSALADATYEMAYPVGEVIAGDDAMFVSISGADTSELPRSIHRIDPAGATSKVVVGAIPADPASPISMVQTNGSIWAVENTANRMLRFDATTGRLLGTIPLGEFPIEPAVGFGAVWSQDFRGGSVTKIDATSGKVVATIALAPFEGDGPRSISAGEKLLWVVSPRMDVLVGIDPARNRVAKTIPLVTNLHCGVAAVAGRVWVGSCDPNPLQVFDEATGAPLSATLTGGLPLFARGGYVWVPSYGKKSTSFVPVDETTLEVATRPAVDLGVPAGWMSVGHGSLWYADGLKVQRLSLDAFGAS